MAFIGSYRMSVLLLLTCTSCILTAAAADYAKYKDPKQPLNRRIDDLLARMTVAEKIGQMSQIERENATADVVQEFFIGSVLSGGGSVPATNATPEAWVRMVNEMQRGALSTRLGIPMLYGIDAVHGHGNVYRATIFPHNVGLGCTRYLAKKIGAAVALEVRATGIPYVFAPCVAVCRDPRWGRCYESFSEDPKLVQQMASHYVGDGGTVGGANEGDTAATFHDLLSVHMPPYYSAVAQGVSTVMVSFSSWNGTKMHANRFLITDFLKTRSDSGSRIDFSAGFVISDWGGIERITTPKGADYMLSVKLAIMAGIDMIMIPYTYTEFIDDLSTLVQNGTIPMSRIDDAVWRILRVKFTMARQQEHRDLAREAVRKSLVLLKNGKAGEKLLLPLPKNNAGSILVAGSHAHNLGNQCGGWTITWQGIAGNNLTTGKRSSMASARRGARHGRGLPENPDDGFMRQNKARFDYAVIVVGEPPYAESFGDNLNLTVPALGPSVIRDVRQRQVRSGAGLWQAACR
ncbi:hypothetical protein ZWY2020_033682 [Hordeum vulgare]|nr:hypothetical protein ZWY2020_033682 [Hordeum vulgare]